MLFRPNFCANCGEKIDRSDWGFFTSRRFCQVCESVFKGQELLPRIVVGLGIVVGLFGIGGYLKSGIDDPKALLTKQPRRFSEQTIPVAQVARKEAPPTEAKPANIAAPTFPETQSAAPMQKTQAQLPRLQQPQIETSAEVYFCGAQTAKGTPCKHRVKGNIRCFQHAGMPALLPADKLKIN